MLFQYGKVVKGKYFYDRKKLIKKISNLIDNGQSFMLKAPRRYGKTSLILKALEKETEPFLHIDFRKVPNLEVLNHKLIDFTYQLMGIEGAFEKLKHNIINFLNQGKHSLTINTGFFEATVEFYAANKNEEEIFSQTLHYIGEIAKQKKDVVKIFFDEFQDIKNVSSTIDIAEYLRAEIQHHENICYIFAGSHMTMMTNLFENKSSPFYNFGRKIKLEAFDKQELSQEIKTAFKQKNIVFENDVLLEQLIDRCNAHPANTMLVMQILESIIQEQDIKLIKQEHTHQAYQEAKEEMNDLIMEYLKEIRSKEHLHDVLYRDVNKIKQKLSPSSLQQKRKALVTMGHLLHIEKGKYQIIDNFLRDELLEE